MTLSVGVYECCVKDRIKTTSDGSNTLYWQSSNQLFGRTALRKSKIYNFRRRLKNCNDLKNEDNLKPDKTKDMKITQTVVKLNVSFGTNWQI